MEYIRKAVPEDAERIRFIAEQCWWLASGDSEAQKKIEQMVHDLYSHVKLTNEITNDLSVFLLLIDGAFAVAFTSYTLRKNDVVASEINALYCLPETQGKRFDELLVNEVIKETIVAGGESIFVVLTNYHGPLALFERLGFQKLKSEALVMSKNIGTVPK